MLDFIYGEEESKRINQIKQLQNTDGPFSDQVMKHLSSNTKVIFSYIIHSFESLNKKINKESWRIKEVVSSVHCLPVARTSVSDLLPA